ncbi:hypothetical protein PPYR_07984 [Photinus pyralis]|uniref:HTH CENPB-type domain-containing protein n=1 Tax=Photinus pyralis TaxID=7054 RepID=A0A5N4AS02_PHOPY|nr:hypothetical protein PPYR_07984 [Photinus pyralis]
MPRVWTKKTDRIRKRPEEISAAIEEVSRGSSLREVSRNYGISFSALQRHVAASRNKENYVHKPNLTVRQVFTPEQEEMLVKYLQRCSKMHYGLTSNDTRKLAYKYAKALEINIPTKWDEEQKGGREWLFGFLRRNPRLGLRTPEATSLSRSTTFNQHNVGQFLNNVQDVYSRFNFTADDIWNCDETGLTTVHKPQRVLAEKGLKQVGQITSGERGQLVTMCCFINASGNTAPPAYIFPRQRNLDIIVFDHFVKHARCSKERPLVLFFDNHDSHVSIEIITAARNSGVYLITFPPHSSHRLQPLDVAVYGTLKTRYNQACDDFMATNPGKPITIYNIGALSQKAFVQALNKSNIIKGFEKAGIWPFSRDIFSEDDFLMAAVTDRVLETPDQPEPSASAIDRERPVTPPSATSRVHATPPPSTTQENVASPASTSQILSPEDVIPYPKAPPRKLIKVGRKPGRTRILTDTPEKEEIEERSKRKVKFNLMEGKKENNLKKIKSKHDSNRKTGICITKTAENESSSDSESFEPQDSSDSEFIPELPEKDFDFSAENVDVDDFLVVKFCTKTTLVYYVGRVEKELDEEYEMNFLRKKGNGFIFPLVQDISCIKKEDVVLKLPSPFKSGCSSRLFSVLYFDVDLTSFEKLR